MGRSLLEGLCFFLAAASRGSCLGARLQISPAIPSDAEDSKQQREFMRGAVLMLRAPTQASICGNGTHSRKVPECRLPPGDLEQAAAAHELRRAPN
jgi:hypothetical protein